MIDGTGSVSLCFKDPVIIGAYKLLTISDCFYCESSGCTLMSTSQLEGMGLATNLLNRRVVNLLNGSVVTPFERKGRMQVITLHQDFAKMATDIVWEPVKDAIDTI